MLASPYISYCHTNSNSVPTWGDPYSQVMTIGISPGPEEVVAQRPDVGQAGQLLDEILTSVHYDNTKILHANLVCTSCSKPTQEQIDTCKPNLINTILSCKPKLIICLGEQPAKEFGLTRRGYLYPKILADNYTPLMMYTHHPASVLYPGGNTNVYDIVRDLCKIPYILAQPVLPLPPLDYTIVKSPLQAQYVLNNLTGPCALDIETRFHDPNTDDLDVYTDDLICLAISSERATWVFPRSTLDNLQWPNSSQSHSKDQGIQWIFHNGMFDVQGLLAYLGISLPIHVDTMLKSYGRDEYAGTAKAKRVGQNKLETLTAEWFADIEYKTETKASWRKHIEPEAHALYKRNALDAYYTRLLDPILDKLEPCPAYESLMIPGANMFARAMFRGSYINRAAMQTLVEEWTPEYIKLAVAVRKHITNPRSWQQKSKYLYASIEEGGLGLVHENAPSTKKDILKELDHPFVRTLEEFTQVNYRMQNWVLGIEQHIKKDGRVHPNVLLHGTETGRRAYHEPPVQTIPKHGALLARIRELFSATTPDYSIIESDYSQLEMWIAAYLSGDLNMLHDLESGDFHQATADRLGVDRERTAKTLNFGILYGMGKAHLAQTLNNKGVECTETRAANILHSWYSSYYTYKEWSDNIYYQAVHEGFITTPSGRIKRTPLVLDSSWRGAIINFPIQGTAGDYILDSLIELEPTLRDLDTHIMFDVHDSGVFESAKIHQKEAVELIQHVMEKPRFGLPGVKVKVTIGDHL